LKRVILCAALVWVVVISLAHWWVNGNLQSVLTGQAAHAQKFRVGFLPVT